MFRRFTIGSGLLAAALVLGVTASPAASGSDPRGPAWIAAEADYLSGRSLTTVCAASEHEWVQAVADSGLPAAGQSQYYYGFSFIQRGEMHLSPYVCEGLQLGTVASSRRANESHVAWSVNVLVHESVHMARFTVDDALVEACARSGLPLELHRLYGVAYRSAEMRRLTLAAVVIRRTQAPAYQGVTACPATAPASR